MKTKLFKKRDYILIVLFGILGAYYFKNLIMYTSASITGGLTNITYCFSVTVAGVMMCILLFMYFKDRYIKEIRGRDKIIYSIILLVLAIGDLLLYISSINIAFNNLYFGMDYYFVSIGVPIAILLVLIYSIFLFITFKKERKEKNRFIKMSKNKYVFFIISSLYAFYGLACLFVSIIVFDNITRYALGFIAIILLFILMIINLLYLVKSSIIYKLKYPIINLTLNLVVLLVFVIAEINHFSFMALVAKPFCPIDFAISKAILPTLSILMILGYMSYDFYLIIKNRK